MSEAEELLNSLSPEKRALFELLLKKKRMNNNVHPLSASQKRMWFMQKLDPESALFNIPAATQIHGMIDPFILEKCFIQLIERHTILQSVFSLAGEEPVCTRRGFEDFKLEVTDLRHLDEACRKQEAISIIERDSRTAFDISSNLLIRVKLFILSGEDSILFILMHHIISDGWSMQLIIRELAELYNAEVSSLPSPLAPLLIQYQDYVKWQSHWMNSHAMLKQRDYWKGRLSPLPERITFPAVTSNLYSHSDTGKHIYRKISGGLPARLKNLAASSNTSMFMVALAVFKTLLLRITSMEDITVATPAANRNLSGSHDIIGLFVNTVLLRDDLSGNPAFLEILRKIKSTVLEAYSNQEYPYDELVKELNPGRAAGQSELFNVMFLYQNNAPYNFPAGIDISLSPVDLDNELSPFDLSFSVSELKDELVINAEYSTAVFSSESIEQMISAFTAIAEAAADDPQKKAFDLPLYSDRMRKSICCTNQLAPLPFTDIIMKIRQNALSAGDSIAVIEGTREFSYHELDKESDRIAACLLKHGIHTEDRVGISLGRSFRLIAGLIGILKAGGIYVPLDPNYPSDRTKYMIDDSGLKVLLTEDKFIGKYSPITSCEIISLDSDEVRNQQEQIISTRIDPDNGAYIIYTSGSTGTPKGVLVTHRSVVNHNSFISRIFELAACDRVLQFSTINFDAAVEEIFPALQSGACLVLRSSELLPSGLELLEQISRDGITVLDMTTSYWQEWVRELYEDRSLKLPASLRLAAIGGESLSSERAGQWKEITGGRVILLNTYGPTETTIISSVYQADGWEETIPIGKPIDNTNLYAVDKYLNPVPCGMQGELMIGGIGLARCYLNKPELTAEKFIPDPFSDIPGKRMYRSGDVVRMRDDGNFEYSSRKDGQIKLRGFRIETREIEKAIESQGGINKAIVLLDTQNGMKRLIGFYTASENTDPQTLKERLKNNLPDFMVPSFLVRLDAFPLALNGKIDLAKLREIKPASRNSAVRNDTEEMSETGRMLAGIWKDLLNSEDISSDDNFFDAGGHSLLLTKLVFRISKVFGVTLTLREALDNAQLKSMARIIEAKKAAGYFADAPEPKIPRSESKALSYSQLRLWALDQIDRHSSVYNIPSVFILKGKLNIDYLEQSINEVAFRHETLRSNIITDEGKPILIINDRMKVKLALYTFNNAGENEKSTQLKELIISEAKRPFNLASDPLIRAILAEHGNDEYLFMLNIHHIVFDGWSSAIFIQELTEIYSSLTEGRKAALPELQIQYSDYAVWQKTYLQGAVLDGALQYWRTRLAGIPGDLSLPYDYPLPEVQKSDGLHETIVIGRELFEAAGEICRSSDITEFIFFFSLFNILLSSYTGQEDICIGTPAANRTYPETENLIGLFVNTIVLRSKITGELTLQEFLMQVKNTVIEAYLNQHLPFEKLVEEINPERRTNRNPLFQVMFIYNNSERKTEKTAPGITVSSFEFENGISMFDLSLILEESDKGLIATIEYNTELFRQSTAVSILKDYSALIQNAVQNYTGIISDLRSFIPEQRNRSVIPQPAADADVIEKPGTFEAVPQINPDYSKKLKLLTGIWKDILHYDSPSPSDNFFEMGGDSILAIQMVAKARTSGLLIEVIDIFRHQSIQELASAAAYIKDNINEQGIISGENSLTPVQKWFFEQNFPNPSHWNQSILINLKEKTNPAIAGLIIRHIVNHHDVLRSRFSVEQNIWIQIIDPGTAPPQLEIIKQDSSLPSDEFVRLHAERVQQSLDIINGPVFKAALFQFDDAEEDKLLIAVHHLVIDGISWMILMEDMQTIFRQLKSGAAISLPLKTASFRSWSSRLETMAQADKIKNEAAYWTGRPYHKVRPVEPDISDSQITEASSASIVSSLTQERTNQLLQDIPGRTKYSVMELLLAALARSYAQWSGRRTVLFDLEGHGRERISPDTDVTRTCGWFTSIYPVVLDLEDTVFTGDSLAVIRRQLNEIPASGFNYGLLRYLCHDPEIQEKMNLIPHSQICFNYLGKMNLGSRGSDGIGYSLSGLKGTERSFDNQLTHMIDINAVVTSDFLQAEWTFSRRNFYDVTIKRLADIYINELNSLIDFCLKPEAASKSAPDFKMASLSQKELNGILKKVTNKK